MDSNPNVKSVCMSAADVERASIRMAHQIVEANEGVDGLVLVGIVTRGDVLAKRIADAIEQIEDVRLPLGKLDISFYRDDVMTYLSPQIHATDIPFSIDGKHVVLVDDVLFTGRTVRAALDALRDIGRPESVQLAVLVDRGHRQLPIRADYVGKNIPSSKDENVRAYLEEVDGFTQVQIQQLDAGARIGAAPLGGR